ncbi:MAG TPA: hypothetical protein VH165_34430 [Kofleriaceae bacterium]|nr:hypothetical protein [Kofleriaceae bacterium]
MSPDLYQRLVAELTPNPLAAFRTREPDGRQLLHYNGATYGLEGEEPIRFAVIGVQLHGYDPNVEARIRTAGFSLASRLRGSSIVLLSEIVRRAAGVVPADPDIQELYDSGCVEGSFITTPGSYGRTLFFV